MGELAALMVRLQQCNPSNCSPIALLLPTPTPVQWKDTQVVTRRVSATMQWATSVAEQHPSEASLKCIFSLNQLLEDILYKSLYVHAVNQELRMRVILR